MSSPDPVAPQSVTWESPGAGYSVQYQLPVFREIDFLVNDGFRRIPHGGVETGGLLLGTVDDAVVRVESFQPIECEHAYGPSFQLSERDIEQLQRQIADAAQDANATGLSPVGWFIAHTRSELVLNEREVALFRQLFPEPGRLTVLLKPERFKATRLAFLVRDRNGEVASDGGPIAFALPQGERAGAGTARRERATEPVAEPVAEWRTPVAEAPPEPPRVTPVQPPRIRPVEVRPVDPPVEDPPVEVAPVEVQPEPVAAPEDVPRREDPVQQASIQEATARQAPVREEAVQEATARDPEPAPPPRFRRVAPTQRLITEDDTTDDTGPVSPPTAVSITEPVPSERVRPEAGPGGLLAGGLLTWSLFGASLVFAVLAIYGLYLRFAPGVVPVTVTPSGDSLLVSWPAAETRDAAVAEVRVNNGPARPLSNNEKASGTFSMHAGGGDLMVDLVVHHRFRTMRGITRYLVMPAASGQ